MTVQDLISVKSKSSFINMMAWNLFAFHCFKCTLCFSFFYLPAFEKWSCCETSSNIYSELNTYVFLELNCLDLELGNYGLKGDNSVLPVWPWDREVLVPPSAHHNCNIKPKHKCQRNQVKEALKINHYLLKNPEMNQTKSQWKNNDRTTEFWYMYLVFLLGQILN